ncbi:hypothetical protein ACLB2K_013623 [Fragaria x ananassa]
MRAGLLIAIDQQWNDVEFESDCATIMLSLARSSEDMSEVSALLNNCKAYMESFQFILLRHVYREANGVAHRLAHLVRIAYLDELLVDESPDIIQDVLMEDGCSIPGGFGFMSPSILQKLENIYVSNCSSLQEIFDLRTSRVNEDEGTMETPSNIYQPDQGILQLNNQMMDFKVFQHLTNIYIRGCESLRKVCSSSIARSLVNLEVLDIESCNKMEEIVAAEEGRIYNNMFPHLRNLTLRISNMVSFSRAKYALDWPSLEYIKIEDCPEMKKFCSGLLITSRGLKIVVSKSKQENIHRELDLSKKTA